MVWYQIKKQQVELRIFVKPNAKQTALVAVSEQELHIAIHAVPREGEANKELISYLAKRFALPKSQIILQRGKGSRHKQVLLPLTPTLQHFLDSPTFCS